MRRVLLLLAPLLLLARPTSAADCTATSTGRVPLNDLVSKTFRVGSVLLRGMELCEPCGYLERRTYPGIKAALTRRGGLRCAIVEGGELRVGDTVRPA